MEEFDIYKDIKERTNGDIYIGVVGPVRTGKSTFITSFMNNMVVPSIKSVNEKERMVDELPQSANGNMVMTTQPKFVPSEAVEVKIADRFDVKIRLIDCVGYVVNGVVGVKDDGKPRMVNTPWNDEAIPFEEAAEIGTKKVIVDHSTIGVVVTTDGSIDTDIDRVNYIEAEEKVIAQLKFLKKPFVILLNTKYPDSEQTKEVVSIMESKYENKVVAVDALNMKSDDIVKIFESVLMEFPLRRIDVSIPKWMQSLDKSNGIISELIDKFKEKSEKMEKMADLTQLSDVFENSENFSVAKQETSAIGEGALSYVVEEKEGLFYKTLSSECGCNIADEFDLMSSVKSLVYAKKEYDKMASALAEANESGYGVVLPTSEDISYGEPQIEKKGNRYGVKLCAKAPSYHIVKVDVSAEVSPLMGASMQSEDTVKRLLMQLDSSQEGIWKTNMLGKSLGEVVGESLENKINSMQSDTKQKMKKALCRIVNEGSGGVICILL